MKIRRLMLMLFATLLVLAPQSTFALIDDLEDEEVISSNQPAEVTGDPVTDSEETRTDGFSIYAPVNIYDEQGNIISQSKLSAPKKGFYDFSSIKNFTVVVNGVTISPDDTDIYHDTSSNKIMVPIALISEELGYEVTWDGEEKAITLNNGEDTIMVFSETGKVFENGEMVSESIHIQSVNGKHYVEIDFFSSIMDAAVLTYPSGLILIETKK